MKKKIENCFIILYFTKKAHYLYTIVICPCDLRLVSSSIVPWILVQSILILNNIDYLPKWSPFNETSIRVQKGFVWTQFRAKKRYMELKNKMLFLMRTWLMLLTWLKLTFLKVPDLRLKVLEDIEDEFLWLQLEGNCKEKFRQITFLSFYYLNRRYVFNHKKRL